MISVKDEISFSFPNASKNPIKKAVVSILKSWGIVKSSDY